MLKNKLKIIAILSVIILALTLPIVRAENETTDDTANADVITSQDSSSAIITDDETFKRTDVYLTGDDVTIDYIVDGNLFVFANHVTINSQIGGDAFICANTVTIGEQGYVFSNLFTFAQNVTVNGVVYDLYAASETTTINGYVYRDIRVGSNTVNIFGTIGRNAYIDCENLNFAQEADTNDEETTSITSQGIIKGNLKYSSKQEASIPDGCITGEITFEQQVTVSNIPTIQEQIMSLGSFLITVIVIWLVCLWLAPNFLKKTVSLLTTKKVLPVIGFGILTPIVAIIVSIILLFLGLTFKLAILLIIMLIVLMTINTSIFVITLNNVICDKLKIQKAIGVFGMLVVSSIVLWLIKLIPFIGSIVSIVVAILGLGIIVSNLVLKEKTEA